MKNIRKLKYVIWDGFEDTDQMIDDYRKEYVEDCEGLSETEISQMMRELHDSYLDDERENLSNIQLPGEILIIAQLGLWDDKKLAYKLLKTKSVPAILNSQMDGFSTCCWGSDGYDIVGIEAHHDGTNRYMYRYIRPGVNVNNLLDNIYHGKEVDRKVLNLYTGSLVPFVHKVYGWKISGQFAAGGGKA